MGSPKRSSNRDREKLQESNRLWRTKKPVGTPYGPKTGGTGCIRRDEEVGKWSDSRRQEKTNAVPSVEKGKPPMEVATELEVEANRMGSVTKTVQEVNHTTEERSTGTDHFTSVVKMTNQGLQFLTMACTFGGPRTEQGKESENRPSSETGGKRDNCERESTQRPTQPNRK